MSEVMFNDETVKVLGHFPLPGETVRSFMLVDKDLRDVSLSQFTGQRKVLNIVPSLDTPVCAESARRFNQMAGNMANTVVLVISADLPFAQARFCSVNGLTNVIALSTLRGRDFHKDYGVLIASYPLAGLCARAVIVLDENDKVLYSELVSDISDEPNYVAALKSLGTPDQPQIS